MEKQQAASMFPGGFSSTQKGKKMAFFAADTDSTATGSLSKDTSTLETSGKINVMDQINQLAAQDKLSKRPKSSQG